MSRLKPWIALALLPAFSGCAPMLIATAGAVAGYAVSRDSVTLDLDSEYDHVWESALEEVRSQGRTKREDRDNGRIDARVQDADVAVTVERLTKATVRVVIRARKRLLPKVDIAQRLAVGIARRV